MCVATSHSGAQSLLWGGGGCSVQTRGGWTVEGRRGVAGRGPCCPMVCGGRGQLQLTGGSIHAIR